MKVKCTLAGEKCGKCPHRKPHKPHKPRQTDWDGLKACTEVEHCAELNKECQCVEVQEGHPREQQ